MTSRVRHTLFGMHSTILAVLFSQTTSALHGATGSQVMETSICAILSNKSSHMSHDDVDYDKQFLFAKYNTEWTALVCPNGLSRS